MGAGVRKRGMWPPAPNLGEPNGSKGLGEGSGEDWLRKCGRRGEAGIRREGGSAAGRGGESRISRPSGE